MNSFTNIKDVIEIGKVVRQKRKLLNLTQEDLAGLCNVGTRFICELENGKKTLEIDKVLKVLNSLGLIVSINERKLK